MNPWDERYGGADYFYGTQPNDFLVSQASLVPPGGKVLCLAEGEGRNAVFLASRGFQVTAVDSSLVGLEKLERLSRDKGVRVEAVHSDLAEFKVEPGAWDGIISIWCHLPKSLREKVHRDCALGLARDGVFILEAYHPKQLEFRTGGPPTADLMMSLGDLRRELELNFLVGAEIERMVSEGKGHEGPSAVVQVVARRE